MDDIRLRRPALWSAGASEARPHFGSLGVGFRPAKAPSPPRSAGALQNAPVSPILRTPLYGLRQSSGAVARPVGRSALASDADRPHGACERKAAEGCRSPKRCRVGWPGLVTSHATARG